MENDMVLLEVTSLFMKLVSENNTEQYDKWDKYYNKSKFLSPDEYKDFQDMTVRVILRNKLGLCDCICHMIKDMPYHCWDGGCCKYANGWTNNCLTVR